MAAADRYVQHLACPCGAAVVVHWIDHGYRHSDPMIERVVGPGAQVRRKRSVALSRDHTDVLCAKCGRTLHESDATRVKLRAV